MWFSGLPAPFLRLGPNWLFPWAAYVMPRGGSLLAMVLSSLPATEGKVVRAHTNICTHWLECALCECLAGFLTGLVLFLKEDLFY